MILREERIEEITAGAWVGCSQKLVFGLLLAKEIYKDKDFISLADALISFGLNDDDCEIGVRLPTELFTELSSLKTSKMSSGNYSPPVTALQAVMATSLYNRKYFLEETVLNSDESVVRKAVTTYLVCPHCFKRPAQHTDAGKCLFSPYKWDSIEKALK